MFAKNWITRALKDVARSRGFFRAVRQPLENTVERRIPRAIEDAFTNLQFERFGVHDEKLGMDAYRRAFGGQLHRTRAPESGIKIVTLGKFDSEAERMISKRVDAWALANPEAAQNLHKVQVLRPVDLQGEFITDFLRQRSVFRGTDAMEAFSQPRTLHEYMAMVQDSPENSFLRKYTTHGRQTNRSNFSAWADQQAHKIVLNPSDQFKVSADPTFGIASRASSRAMAIDRVMTHELGHFLHGPSGLGPALPPPENLHNIINSRYSKYNNLEAYAESYATLIHEPQSITPEIVEFLNSGRGGIRQMRALPNASLNQGPRHSSARSGLAVRSSATGRFSRR